MFDSDNPDTPQNPVPAQPPVNPVKRSLQIAKEEGLPTEAAVLMPAIMMQESNGNPGVTGEQTKYGKAMGAMQIIPSTWDKYKHRPDADPYNLDDNLRAGARYVKDLYEQSGGDLRKVLSGYYGAASGRGVNYADDVISTVDQIRGDATSYLQKLGESNQPQAVPQTSPTAVSPASSVAEAVAEPKLGQKTQEIQKAEKVAADTVATFTRQSAYQQDINRLAIAKSPEGSRVATGFDPIAKITRTIPLENMGLDQIIQSKDPLAEFTKHYFQNMGLDQKQSEEFMAATGWKLENKDNLLKQLGNYAQWKQGQPVAQAVIPTQVNVATEAMVEAFKSGGAEAAKQVRVKMDAMKSTFDQTVHALTPEERAKFSDSFDGTIAKLGAQSAVAENIHFWDNLLKSTAMAIPGINYLAATPLYAKAYNKAFGEMDKEMNNSKDALAQIGKSLTVGENLVYQGVPMAGMILRNAALYGPVAKGALKAGDMIGRFLGPTLSRAIPQASNVGEAITNWAGPTAAKAASSGTFVFDSFMANMDKPAHELKSAVTNAAIISAIPWASRGLLGLSKAALGTSEFGASAVQKLSTALKPAARFELPDLLLSVPTASAYMYADTKKNGGSEAQARAAALLGIAPVAMMHLGAGMMNKLSADPSLSQTQMNPNGTMPIDIRKLPVDFQMKVFTALTNNLDHPVISNLIDIETKNWAASQGIDAAATKAAFDKIREINGRRAQQGGVPMPVPPAIAEPYQRILEFYTTKQAEVAMNGVATLAAAAFDPNARSPIVQDRAAYAPLASVTNKIKEEMGRLVPEVDTTGGSAISLGLEDATTLANKLLAHSVDTATKNFAIELLNQVDKAKNNDYTRVGVVNIENPKAAVDSLHESYHGKQSKEFRQAQEKAKADAETVLNDPELNDMLTKKFGEAGAKHVQELFSRKVQNLDFTGSDKPEYVRAGGADYQTNKSLYNPEVRNSILTTLYNDQNKASEVAGKFEGELRRRGYFQNPSSEPMERVYEAVPALFDPEFLKRAGLSPKDGEALVIAELRSLNLEDPSLNKLVESLPKTLREPFQEFLSDRTTKKYEKSTTERTTKAGSTDAGKGSGNAAPTGGDSGEKPVPSTNDNGKSVGTAGAEAKSEAPVSTGASETKTNEPKSEVKSITAIAAEKLKEQGKAAKEAEKAQKVAEKSKGRAAKKAEQEASASEKSRQGVSDTKLPAQSKERAKKAKGGEEPPLEDMSASLKGPKAGVSEFTEPTSEGLRERAPRDLDIDELKEARAKFASGEYQPNQTVTLSTGVKVRMPSKISDLYNFTKKAKGEKLIGKKGEPEFKEDNSETPYGRTARTFMAKLASDKNMRAGFAAHFGLSEEGKGRDVAQDIKEAINISVNNPNMSAKKIGKLIEAGDRMSGDSTEVKRLGNLSSSDLMIWANRRGLGDLMPSHIQEMGKEVARQKAGKTTSLYNRYGEPDESGFYSKAEKLIDSKFKGKISIGDLENFLKNNKDLKKDEIKWSGLDDFVTGKKMSGIKSVNKEDLLKYVNANRIRLEPAFRGDNEAYNQWKKKLNDIREEKRKLSEIFSQSLAQGTSEESQRAYDNWNAKRADLNNHLANEPKRPNPAKFQSAYSLAGADAGSYREMTLRLQDPYRREDDNFYHAIHWGNEKNVLGFSRYDTRTDVEGKRVMHVAEIQSDWEHAYRDFGVRDAAKEKRLKDEYIKLSEEVDNIRYAPNNDLDSIFDENTPVGKEYANLIKKMDVVETALNDAMKAAPDAPLMSGINETIFRKVVQEAAKAGVDRLTWDTGDTQIARYPGGAVRPNFKSGMRNFYDKKLVDYAKKFGAKWKAEVGDTEVNGGRFTTTTPAHYIEITPEMKKSVTQEGISLFNRKSDYTEGPDAHREAAMGDPNVPLYQKIHDMTGHIKKSIDDVRTSPAFSPQEKRAQNDKWNEVMRKFRANDAAGYARAVYAAQTAQDELFASKRGKFENSVDTAGSILRVAPLTSILSRTKDVIGTMINVGTQTATAGLKHQAARLIDSTIASKAAASKAASQGKAFRGIGGQNPYSEVFPEMSIAQWPKDVAEGYLKGIGDAVEIAKEGNSTFQTASGVHFQFANRVYLGDSGAGKTAAKVINRAGAIFGNAFDAPAVRAAYEFTMGQFAAQHAAQFPQHLRSSAMQQFRDNPPPLAAEVARVAAEYMTYNNENGMARVLQNVANAVDGPVMKTLIKGISASYFRYTKVPTNVWSQRMRLSPASVGTILYDIAALHKSFFEGYDPVSGKFNISAEKRYGNMQRLTNSAAGLALTAAMATGTILARNAIMSYFNNNIGSSYGRTEKDINSMDLSKGLEPGSMKVPGTNKVVPVGTFGNVQANLEDQRNWLNNTVRPNVNNTTGTTGPPKGVFAASVDLGRNLAMDHPVGKGVVQMARTITGETDPVKNELNIGQVGFVRDVGSAIDQYRRVGNWEQANRAVAGFGQDLPKRMTSSGEPVKRPAIQNAFLKEATTSPGLQELDRLGMALPVHQVQQANSRLSSMQLESKAEFAGKAMKETVDKAVQSSAYQKLKTDEDRTMFLHNTIKSAQAIPGLKPAYAIHNAEVKTFENSVITQTHKYFKNMAPAQQEAAENYIKAQINKFTVKEKMVDENDVDMMSLRSGFNDLRGDKAAIISIVQDALDKAQGKKIPVYERKK